MINLNRKGYMTIEIILASVITFVIAFFLLDITMKLSSNTDDAYSDTILVTDKAIITKNVKENLENDICVNDGIKSVSCSSDACDITMNSSNVYRLSVSGNRIVYRFSNSYSRQIENNYFKEIDSSLSNIKITSSSSNGYYFFKISGTNIFMDENYDINIFVYSECR